VDRRAWGSAWPISVLTEVRQRVAREQLGRRGRKVDPAWAHRRLLLRAGDRLGSAGRARLRRVLPEDDPSNEIGAAWGCKELLRRLLAARTRHDAAQRLYRFYDACLVADMAETHPAGRDDRDVVAAHRAVSGHRGQNARTEGYNRVIKQLKRVGPQPGQLRASYRLAHRRQEGSVTPAMTASPPSTAKSRFARSLSELTRR